MKCSVPNCDNNAFVEVRLYDVYPQIQVLDIYDQEDSTCPYLCKEHLAENEAGADGERRPRGKVYYPHTNKHCAQGFNIYRKL